MDTLSAEPCMVTSKLRERGDVRENGKDKFVWEFENCENRMEQVSIRTTEVTQEIVMRLVWGAGDRSISANSRKPDPPV